MPLNLHKLPSIVDELVKLEEEYLREPKVINLESKVLNFLNTYKSLPMKMARKEYDGLLN